MRMPEWLRRKIADHYFYKWIRTKDRKYMNRYLDLSQPRVAPFQKEKDHGR